jgi:hypothetical protein
MVAGTTIVVYSFRGDDREANHPRLPGGRVVIARGDGWTLLAWNSGGLCTSLVFGENQGRTSWCFLVVGAPRPREVRGREHVVAGGASYRGLSNDDLWIHGVAAANVSRVEVELADGRSLQAPVYDAPATLGLDLKFFLVRTRFRIRTHWDSASGLEIPEPPFRAFSAYDGRGRLLERFDAATAS